MIEGIPDGWELVAFREATEGEYFVNNEGKIEKWTLGRKSGVRLVIIRKIEKPKQYRPFANAAEFRPYKGRWLTRVDQDGSERPGECRIVAFDDVGIWLGAGCDRLTYKEVFSRGHKFISGSLRTPFGIEVTE